VPAKLLVKRNAALDSNRSSRAALIFFQSLN